MKEKLKLICNYKEEFNPLGNKISHHFVDFSEDDTEEEIRRKKKEGRDRKLNELFGEIPEVKEDKKEDEWINHHSTLFSISPKVWTLHLNSKPFKDYVTLYENVINEIDRRTSKPKKISLTLLSGKSGTPQNMPDLILCDDREVNFRKLMAKVMMSSNIIAANGRIGSGTTVILGKNNWSIVESGIVESDIILGMNVIYDQYIDPDKVIVLRVNNVDQNGIVLIDNSVHNKYFLSPTTSWDGQFCWFWVK